MKHFYRFCIILSLFLLLPTAIFSQPLPGQRPTVLQHPDMIGEYVVTHILNSDNLTASDTPLMGKLRVILSPNYCAILQTAPPQFFDAIKYQVVLVEGGDYRGILFDPVRDIFLPFMRVGTADGNLIGMVFEIDGTSYLFEKKSTNHIGITNMWLRVGLRYEIIAGRRPFESLTLQNVVSLIETRTNILTGTNYIEDHVISLRTTDPSIPDLRFERAGRFLIFDTEQIGFNGISLLYSDDLSELDTYPSWSMPR